MLSNQLMLQNFLCASFACPIYNTRDDTQCCGAEAGRSQLFMLEPEPVKKIWLFKFFLNNLNKWKFNFKKVSYFSSQTWNKLKINRFFFKCLYKVKKLNYLEPEPIIFFPRADQKSNRLRNTDVNIKLMPPPPSPPVVSAGGGHCWRPAWCQCWHSSPQTGARSCRPSPSWAARWAWLSHSSPGCINNRYMVNINGSLIDSFIWGVGGFPLYPEIFSTL